MKWTKATERLPQGDKKVSLKWKGEPCAGIFTKDWGDDECEIVGRGTYFRSSFIYIEWLDETESPSLLPDENVLEKEANTLYPHKEIEKEPEYDHVDVTERERAAYIQGRRRSIARIKELEKLLKQTEEIAQIATEGLKEASKEIDRLKEDRDDWKRISKHAGNRR
jgi:hypothetical protein